MKRRGVPLVVSAPSGAGKTTLCRRLMERLADIEFSVSHTTRAPRGAESDGRDYHFVDDPTFDRLVQQGAFLEWAAVHGHRYGTARQSVEDKLQAGTDVLLDIDVQGGRQVAEHIADAVLVLVVPPDLDTLERRLRGRGTDSDAQIVRRLQAAKAEVQAADFYTYWLVNDDLEQAVTELEAVLRAERLRRLERTGMRRALFGEAS